jgi:hypothetical protein
MPSERDFHTTLLDSWTHFLRNSKTDARTDDLIANALFTLVIKSLVVTKDTHFGGSLFPLMHAYALKEGSGSSNHAIEAFARFLNLLFDLGHYSHAVRGLASQCKCYFAVSSPNLQRFLEQALTPRIFYFALTTLPVMRWSYESLLSQARCDFPQLFLVFLRLFHRLPDPLIQKIVRATKSLFRIITPLSSMPTPRQFPLAAFFLAACLNSFGSPDVIREWWEDDADKPAIFASLHYMLDRSTVGPDDGSIRKEQCISIHSSILRFLRVVLPDTSVTGDVTLVLYHHLHTNFFVSEFATITNLLAEIVRSDPAFMFYHCVPILPKFLMRLFIHSVRCSLVSTFLVELVNADQRRHGSDTATVALACRALWHLAPEALAQVHLSPDRALAPISAIADSLKSVDLALARGGSTISDEEAVSIRQRRILALRPSPDAVVEELLRLSTFHGDHGYTEEQVQAHVLAIAVIAEYLTLQRRIPRFWGTLHPAAVFAELCSDIDTVARCPTDHYPTMPGVCDSDSFNLKALIRMVERVPVYFTSGNASIEQALILLDIVWPLYEATRTFRLTSRFFKIIGIGAQAMPPPTERVFGPYFRVSFFGAPFGEKWGHTYIFRERPLTHLYELAQRLVREYEAMLGIAVTLIKESGECSPDPQAASIQITFVEPYFRKSESRKRVTLYDISHNVDTFFFDAPFIKDSERVHGALDEQWIRRTLLKVKAPMPSVWKVGFVPPEGIVVREFPPIRVAFRQIRDRVGFIENAYAARDARKVQQLLHGSLLVQVNEGPAKIAEVFLAKPGVDLQYEKKLGQQFVAFLNACAAALKFHGEWTRENVAFKALQDELESGFAGLEEKLMSLITMRRIGGRHQLVE